MQPKGVPLQFSVDMRHLDLGALIELSDDRGMMFGDSQGRDSFFRMAELEPTSVPYGAALSHAKATNLGAWGNEGALYGDCARIMAVELRRLEAETGITFGIAEDELMRSLAFRQAYDVARAPKRASVNNLVRSLGSNSERLPLQAVTMGQAAADYLHDLPRRVILELRGQGYRGELSYQ